MAWNTPRTWVLAEVVTATLFNAQIRDNFLVASTHAHGGAAGDGNDELVGLDSANFDFIGDPSAPGASKVIFYAKSGGLFYREGAAGAVLQISEVDHTHTFVEHIDGEAMNIGGNNLTGLADNIGAGATQTASFTLTITDTVQVVAFAGIAMDSNANNWELKLSIAGTDVDTDLTHSGSEIEPMTGSLARTSDATVQIAVKNDGLSGKEAGECVAAIAINI